MKTWVWLSAPPRWGVLGRVSIASDEIPWARLLIKETVELGLLFQRTGVHNGGTKAWWQEQLRAHIRSIHKRQSKHREWHRFKPVKSFPLAKATQLNHFLMAPPNGDQLLILWTCAGHFHWNYCTGNTIPTSLESRVSGVPWLHSKFEASLEYLTLN